MELQSERHVEQEQKPGTGVDRTLIQRLLAVSPEERVKLLVEESNNMSDLLRQMRSR